MAANRLNTGWQPFHGRTDFSFSASHVHYNGARPQDGAERLQHLDDCAHRRGQDDNIGPGDSGTKIGCRQVDRIFMKSAQDSAEVAGNAPHFSAEVALLQIDAQACAHQAQPDDCNTTLRKRFHVWIVVARFLPLLCQSRRSRELMPRVHVPEIRVDVQRHWRLISVPASMSRSARKSDFGRRRSKPLTGPDVLRSSVHLPLRQPRPSQWGLRIPIGPFRVPGRPRQAGESAASRLGWH